MIQFGNKEAASIYIGGKEVQKIEIGGKTAYEKAAPVQIDYFYIENTDSNSSTLTLTSTLSGVVGPSEYSQTVQYSKDKTNWTTITFDIQTPYTIRMDQGEKVYFRNDNGKFNYTDGSKGYHTTFTCSRANSVGGDIKTLLDYTDLNNVSLSGGCFSSLLEGNIGLIDASDLELPSQTSYRCYYRLFYGCVSLTTTPSLPATTLSTECYRLMFSNCTSLTVAPSLPATTLAESCYYSMFEGSSITSAPNLPATTLYTNCYRSMFYNTPLTTVPVLPATTLALNCYLNMFRDTNITTAPDLPATTLAEGCYRAMFQSDTLLTTPPVLPATILAKECYKDIFSGCSSLNHITTYANDISASNCIYRWLNGVAVTGTFYNNGSATYTTSSASGIPTGWTEDTSNRFVFSNTVITNVGNNQAQLTSGIQVNYKGTWDDGYFEVYNELDKDRSVNFSPSDISNGVLTASNLISESNVATLVSPATVTIYDSGTAVWTGSVSFTVVP